MATNIIDIVLDVWEGTYEEFYTWKRKWIAEELAAIGSDTAIKAEDDVMDVDPMVPRSSEASAQTSRETLAIKNPNPTKHRIWRFPANKTTVRQPIRGVETVCKASYILPPSTFKAVPPYEACTPLMKNINNVPNTFDEEEIKFIPYADELSGNDEVDLELLQIKHQRYNDRLQRIDRDPDRKHVPSAWKSSWLRTLSTLVDDIICETVRRLHFEHGLSIVSIDGTGVLPKGIIMENGALWDPSKTRYGM